MPMPRLAAKAGLRLLGIESNWAWMGDTGKFMLFQVYTTNHLSQYLESGGISISQQSIPRCFQLVTYMENNLARGNISNTLCVQVDEDSPDKSYYIPSCVILFKDAFSEASKIRQPLALRSNSVPPAVQIIEDGNKRCSCRVPSGCLHLQTR